MMRLVCACAVLCATTVASWAAPVRVSGSFDFAGDANVAAFGFSFDEVVELGDSTAPIQLSITGGPATVGATTFSSPLWLWFRSNAFGGLGALVTSQGEPPEFDNDYFQIAAVFASSVTRDDLGVETLNADLRSLDYVIAGAPPVFSFGEAQGLGAFTIAPAAVPLPAPAAMLLAALSLGGLARRRCV